MKTIISNRKPKDARNWGVYPGILSLVFVFSFIFLALDKLPFIVLTAVVFLGVATVIPLEATEAKSQPNYHIIRESNVPVPMRDGVKLGADIYRPDAPGRFPVLMVLRYFRGGHQNEAGEFFAQRGYVVALVDSRGRGDSEGKWVSYVNEPQDGYDAQQWLGTQSWSNGKIGTFGISYNAFTQVMPAPLGSPYLKCLFPQEGQQTNFGHLYSIMMV